MLRIISLCVALVIALTGLAASTSLYSLGATGGFSQLSGNDSTAFGFTAAYGGVLGYNFRTNWALSFDATVYKHTDEDIMINKGLGLGMTLDRYLSGQEDHMRLFTGLGGGVLFWKSLDPDTEELLIRKGTGGEDRLAKASELFARGRIGLTTPLGTNFSLRWWAQLDYLTTAGADFSKEVNSERDKMLFTSLLAITYEFGQVRSTTRWASDDSWTAPRAVVATSGADHLDGDGDGVPDTRDECLNTPFGAMVGKDGCPKDSDGDGVVDGLDDCPNTERQARRTVDVFGCPIDSDFDGLADYEDKCPHNPIGAQVDSAGCPLDTDADGIPDGLDDCPHTLYGVDVDRRGCIDLAVLNEPMILNIDYISGSFEIDPVNQERVKSLSRLLIFVKEIKLEVSGYTDNIGTAEANATLSEKRANRVRDFLVAQGVESHRIKVFGRGETSFVAPNTTAEGRNKNRRVEIVFFR
jgi:hypothetical protein